MVIMMLERRLLMLLTVAMTLTSVATDTTYDTYDAYDTYDTYDAYDAYDIYDDKQFSCFETTIVNVS